MKTVIQKFGGTSIGKANRLKNVADIVQKTLEQDYYSIVVLSAMSSGGKKDGTTSKLMDAANEAINKGSYYKIIDQLEDHHLDVTSDAIQDRTIRENLKEEIHQELNSLKSFLDAIQVIGEVSARSMDVIISTGEKLSAMIFSELLNSLGTDAVFVNLDNLLNKQFPEFNQKFFNFMQNRLSKRIEACGAKVPVVTGFFGYIQNGILKSVGRGYTDFTAALIATSTEAHELQIWKEVDGIFTADPKKVKNAKPLDSITPDEAAELTYFGSEVIHPFTMEQVINANIPVRIKNTFDSKLPGTMIHPNVTTSGTKKGPTAVTVKRDIVLVNIQSNRMLLAYGFMSRVFDIFNRYEIIIDLISTSEVNISVSLDDTQKLDPAIEELEKLGDVSVKTGMAILSLVGQGMKHTLGIAGEMFTRLAKAGINIEAISQGASEINISCAIDDKQSDKALRAVHEMLI